MSEQIECGACWRRDNLSNEQAQDVANLPTGTELLCDEHQAFWDEMLEYVAHAFIKRGPLE